MRFVQAALLSFLCAFAGIAAATATKTTAKTVTAKKVTTKSAAKGKKAPVPVATWRTRQQNPTPERYKEIQQALVDKGYLKSEPTGVWDADSIGALQRFQMDQKMTATGKINAPSLIGLGLGAKSAGAPEAPPPRPPQPTADPPPPALPSAPQ